MFKQFIDRIPEAEYFMGASLLIFFLFFVGVVLYLVLADKGYLQYMSNLPMEDNSNHA
jgi:cytochrome c oxidase cbb3-type subunit IV